MEVGRIRVGKAVRQLAAATGDTAMPDCAALIAAEDPPIPDRLCCEYGEIGNGEGCLGSGGASEYRGKQGN